MISKHWSMPQDVVTAEFKHLMVRRDAVRVRLHELQPENLLRSTYGHELQHDLLKEVTYMYETAKKRRDLRRRKADITSPLVAHAKQTREGNAVTLEQAAERRRRAKAAHTRMSDEDIDDSAQLVFDETWAAPSENPIEHVEPPLDEEVMIFDDLCLDVEPMAAFPAAPSKPKKRLRRVSD